MSYIQKLFNKSIHDIKITDIESFFKEKQEETNILEFKSGEVEIIDLYKEISAFLNTEGGIIVVGAPREQKEKVGILTKTICVGELTYSKFRGKDWLSQKILSNISPPPNGLKIFEHIDTNGSIFLLDIPQSTNPPHQCNSDGRYYIRLEREAKAAPHGIVQALFQKRRLPELSANIKIQYKDEIHDNITISLLNKSRIPADKVSFIVDVFNVESIDSTFLFEKIQDDLGPKFSCSKSTDSVLVRVISIPVNFTVNHKNSEYIISVCFYSKDTDFDFQFWTYNSSTKEIVCKGNLGDAENNFMSEIKRIMKNGG